MKIYNYFKNIAEENISQELRLKLRLKTRNYLIEKKKSNRYELTSKKHKKACTVLNYIEHFLIFGSTFTGCISISVFAFLVGVLIGFTSFAIGLKTCTITEAINNISQ